MRTGRQNGPEAAILDQLRFDLPCDLFVALKLARPIMLWRCKRPARWATRNDCCGAVMLSCRKHRDVIGKCERCKLAVSLLRWSRI